MERGRARMKPTQREEEGERGRKRVSDTDREGGGREREKEKLTQGER